MKLKNLLGKAVVVGAVAMAAIVMGAVPTLAATDPVLTTNGYNAGGVTNILLGNEIPETHVNCEVTEGEGKITYTYDLGTVAAKDNTAVFYGLDISSIKVPSSNPCTFQRTSYITFETDGKFDIKITPPSGKNCADITLAAGSTTVNNDENVIDSTATNNVSIEAKDQEKGVYTLGSVGGNSRVKEIEITVYASTSSSAPSLELEQADRTVTATINDVTATDVISAIEVLNGDEKIGDITNIKVDDLNNPTTYGFTVEFTGEGDLANVKFKLTSKSGSRVYELTPAAA